MASNYVEFNVQLVDDRTKNAINDDAGLFTVLQDGVPLEETVFSNDTGTSLTLPATMTDGRCQFYIDSGTTTVDLSVMDEKGRAYFLKGIDISQHRIDVNQHQMSYTLIGAWALLSAHAADAVSLVKAPVSGGLPAGIKINDVWVHKTLSGVGLGAGLLVDFGVSGDPNGFIDGITASTTGYDMVDVDLTVASGTALGESIVMGIQTRGLLLCDTLIGESISESLGRAKGMFTRKPYMISLVTTTNNLVFAITDTSACATGLSSRGYVYYEYTLALTQGN